MKKQVFGIREKGINYLKRPGVYGLCFEEVGMDIQVAVINTPRGYFLPGGGIELNEDHKTCLKREFIEETGLSIELGEFIGASDQVGFTPNTKRYLELQGHFYLVKILKSIGGKVEDDHELVWLKVEDAIKNLVLDYQSYAVSEGFLVYTK